MVNPIINTSMRQNYGTYGVEQYYYLVQESYRNPHYPGLKKCIAQLMDTFVVKERPKTIKVLDLAAGSGEATEALLSWKASRWPTSSPEPSGSAPNPQKPPMSTPSSRPPFVPPTRQIVRPIRPNSSTTLTHSNSPSSLPEPNLSITATDPFTAPAYRQRTGLECLELSFAQVAAGELPNPKNPFKPSTNRKEEEQDKSGEIETSMNVDLEDQGEEGGELYDIVIVSFALHLVETPSELWALLTELSKRARWLCVVAPHKKPEIKSSWGWTRWDPSTTWTSAEGRRGAVGGVEGDGFEIVLDRVRLRLWRSEETMMSYE